MREAELTVEKPLRPERRRLVRPHEEGAFPMLKWAAAHYGWVVLLAGVLGGLLASQVPAVTGAGIYQAEAVVTAGDLVIEPEQLPQTAGAIFSAGEVARTAVELAEVDIDPVDLIPDHVRLEPVENTVVLRVVAVNGEAETAAALANGAARGLVTELQRLGAGVGRFALHTPAAVPAEPTSGPPVPPAVIGVVAGLLFGIGVVGLVLVIRRPVIGPDSLASALGHPVAGSLALSSVDATGDLRFIPHLAPIVTDLFPRGDERRFLVGVQVRRRALRLVGMVLVRTLARSHKAALVGEGVTRQSFGTESERSSLLVAERSAPTAGIPTVVLGRFLPDDSEPLDPEDGWVLVVGKGASLHRIRRAAAELEGLPVVGIVFLRPLGLRDVARRQNPHVS